MDKTICNVFKDFNGENFEIWTCPIFKMDLYKKSNKLEIGIISKSKIKVEEIAKFDKYLKERFKIENNRIEIKYEGETSFNIEEEITKQWPQIVTYMGEKFPLTKALLIGSNLNINENKITVKLITKGKDILHGRNFDMALSELLEAIYGKKYAILYDENITEEQTQNTINALKAEEEKAIKKIQSGAINTPKVEEIKDKKQDLQDDKSHSEEESPLILGRTPKGNDPIVKINDISVDSGTVTICR